MTVNNKTKNERNILALMTEVIDIALDAREKRHSKSPSISVDDALKKYLMSSQVADSTKRGYKILLDKALPVLGLSPKDEDIVAFRDTRRCKPGGKHLYHRYLRAFYNWLYSPASGYPQFRQEDNPIRFVKPPKVPKRTMPAQTKKTVETLFANIENLRDAAIIAVLFDSGGRLAEITNIQATDILWDKRQIRAIAKGNKEVLMPLGVKSLNLLKQRVAEYHAKSGNVWGLTKDGIVSMLRRLENKSGVICNAHTFRRGFASELRRAGVDTLDIMNLGHWNSPSMVVRYTESVNFDNSQMRYKAPMGELVDSTRRLPETGMVPRPRIELGTRRFSVYQQGLTLEILQHLVSIGQASEHLLRSIQLDNSISGETMSKTDDAMLSFERMFKEGEPTE